MVRLPTDLTSPQWRLPCSKFLLLRPIASWKPQHRWSFSMCRRRAKKKEISSKQKKVTRLFLGRISRKLKRVYNCRHTWHHSISGTKCCAINFTSHAVNHSELNGENFAEITEQPFSLQRGSTDLYMHDKLIIHALWQWQARLYWRAFGTKKSE
jgi:hypothetical protein